MAERQQKPARVHVPRDFGDFRITARDYMRIRTLDTLRYTLSKLLVMKLRTHAP